MKGTLRTVLLMMVLALAGAGTRVWAQPQAANCPASGCLSWSPSSATVFPPTTGFGNSLNPIGLTANPCGTPYTVTVPAGNNHVRAWVRSGITYTVSICGTAADFNSKLYIVPNLTPTTIIACVDEGCGDPEGDGHPTFTFTPSLAPGTNAQYRFYLFLGDAPTLPTQDWTFTLTCSVQTPPNDQFCNAIELPVTTGCNFTFATTVGASNTLTSEVNPAIPVVTNTDCASGANQYVAATGDTWFSAVVPASGSLGIATSEAGICAGSFALYRITGGSCPGVVSAAYVGGSCTQASFTTPGGDPSAIFNGLTPGERVYIRYWERSGPQIENGSFQICAFDPERPPNDNPCGAITINATPACNAQTYSLDYALPINGAVTAPTPTCGAVTPLNDVWFRVPVTPQVISDGITVTTFAGTQNNVAMELYTLTGACPGGGSMTPLATALPGFACNTSISGTNNMASINTRSPLVTTSLSGVSFIYVRVWSETPFYGTFSMCVVQNELPTNDDPCGAIEIPLNFGCVLQSATNANGTFTSPTLYGGSPQSIPNVTAPACGPLPGSGISDVWYRVRVPNPIPSPAVIRIDTDNGLLENGGIAVYRENTTVVPLSTGCPSGLRLQLIGCDANSSTYGSPMPGISVTVQPSDAGRFLYVRVWTQTGPNGNFSICATRQDQPTGNCVWQVNLFDSGGDGWQGSSVTVCNNGVCNTYTNLNGTPQPVSLSFGVTAGTPFSVTYNSNGAGQQNQNRFTVVQTNFNPPSQVFNSGNAPANGSGFSTVAADCAPPPSPPTDCLGAIPMCQGETYNPPTNSGVPELTNATARGCLSGESQGIWLTLNVAQDGIMAFTISYQAFEPLFWFLPIPIPTTDYDFAMWGPYGPYEPVNAAGTDTASLSLVCPPTTAPIRCDASGLDRWLLSGQTGLQNNNALATSQGVLGNPFVRHLNVTTGQVYLLYVNRVNGGRPFTISWQNVGPGGAPLNPNPLPDYTEGNPLLVCGPLPVELLDFQAKAGAAHVDVQWTTGNERHTDYHEVQRSADGVNWLPIGRLQAAGFSQRPIDYHLVDDSPLPGTSHYRLRLVDTDGTWDFSTVATVHFQQASGGRIGALELFPNPAQESITVGFDLQDEGLVQWRIMDASGRLVEGGTTAGDRGRNRFVIPLARLEGGTYVLDLRDAKGGPVGTARFVKQ